MTRSSPLSREQEALRGRKVEDMTNPQLALWLRACDAMEVWVSAAKARRTWKRARARALAEIAKREERASRREQATTQ